MAERVVMMKRSVKVWEGEEPREINLSFKSRSPFGKQ